MKKVILCIVCLCGCMGATMQAQENLLLHYQGNVIQEYSISEIDTLRFRDNHLIVNDIHEIPLLCIDSMTFEEGLPLSDSNVVTITYLQESVWVDNPLSQRGVNVSVTGTTVSVVSTSDIEYITYKVSGTASAGSLSLQSTSPVFLRLQSLALTNPSGAAIALTGSSTSVIELDGNDTIRLIDGLNNSRNATLFVAGDLVLQGNAPIKVIGNTKHAISCSKSITLKGGQFFIVQTAGDGIHGESISMQNGFLQARVSGDALDGGSGSVSIYQGNLDVTVTAEDTKGIKGDAGVMIYGGTLKMNISGVQAKGISSKDNIVIQGGNLNITTSGAAKLTASGNGYDPAYCTAIKSDKDILVNNGNIFINCTSTCNGGKGLSADGNIIISGGTLDIRTAGNGATYTNVSGVKDSYTASAIKSDANIEIRAGNIACTSTGTGGKGISAEGSLVIGMQNADNSLLTINVSTSGEQFLVTGSGQNADYANPKAIKSEGNLTVYSGTITVTCTQTNEGGEGLESKSTLTIAGGQLHVECRDDCLNAAQHLAISGGNTYCHSSGNDAIDCNGTLSVSGGFTIATGAGGAEDGFDDDQNTFAVTGGIMLGTGGSTSNPTTNACTQRSIKYSATSGDAIGIKNATTGEIILLYTIPTIQGSTGGGPGGGPGGPGGSSGKITMLFSDPRLTAGSYTLQYGGTITGGTTQNGYNTGGTYSGGSTKSFTISSMLTTVN
ncbi:MAG: carbohydrate-binding domain-containing protein [Bacteroidales bacterium]|nr:carbohydrate-binding domain-containing protein [Bacteroidales bacterium]